MSDLSKEEATEISSEKSTPNERLLTWSNDCLHLRDGQSGMILAELKGHTHLIKDALVLPNNQILSWSSENTLRLWNGETGKLLTLLTGHTDQVMGALALPDSRILSWAEDKTLRLWDGQSGKPLAVLKGHGGLVLPNGQILSRCASPWLAYWPCQTRSIFRFRKKRSHTALSQQFPFLLMLCSKP